MARALIVGCGCRGRALAANLVADGHAARGTTRDPGRLRPIEAAGAEPVVADPDRLSTLTPQLEGVGVLCWLMGTAAGRPDTVAALHGPRLESMLEAIVDAPIRGVVYEAAGTVDPELLRRGASTLRRIAATNRIPFTTLERHPSRHREWLEEASSAVSRVLRG